jgi:hypothetical protein
MLRTYRPEPYLVISAAGSGCARPAWLVSFFALVGIGRRRLGKVPRKSLRRGSRRRWPFTSSRRFTGEGSQPTTIERILPEIRRRARVVGAARGQSALYLVAEQLAISLWSTKVYLNMELLRDQQMSAITASVEIGGLRTESAERLWTRTP